MIRFIGFGDIDLDCNREERDPRPVLSQPKRLAVLSYLVIARPRGYHRKDTLLGLFWPEADQHQARRALSRTLYFLRHHLGKDVLVGRGGECLAVNAARMSADVWQFENALEHGDKEGALAVYRGELLPGFFTACSPDFEQWLDTERARLHDLAVAAALEQAEEFAARHDFTRAVHWARYAASVAPYEERVCAALVRVLDRSGDRATALRIHEEFGRRLLKQLGVSTSPELTALIDGIRQRSTAFQDSFVDSLLV